MSHQHTGSGQVIAAGDDCDTLAEMLNGDCADARRMAFATSHESFEVGRKRDARQMAIAHRMRAGIGLSPIEYAELY